MDDILITEAVETVRDRLHEEIPDLQMHLDRLELTDYRTASSVQLQECLTQVTYNLDMRLPRDAREIQRRIAIAEAFTPAVGAAESQRAPSWVIQENVILDVVDIEQDARFSQGLRYLSLPPCNEPPHKSTPRLSTRLGDEADIPTTPASAVPPPPTRMGQELLRCTSTRQAIACVRKRLPSLKGLAAYEFLAAIGYPTATPSPEAVRFCRYIGLLSTDDKTPAESYIAIIRRASRVTGISITHISYLIAIYSGAKTIDSFKPICSKRPQCGTCALAGRCANYTAAAPPAHTTDRRQPINKWAVDERPRERLLAGERLSNTELLAIILRTGSGRLSAVELAREVINQFQTLHDLEKASPQDIVQRMKGKGIGMAKAAEICAAIELGRRVSQPAADTRLGLRQVASSRDIFELCRPRYKAATQEEFLLLILNTKNRIQKEVPVSLGTLNSSIVHPRDVFRHALREAAAAVIFVHNHPSGDPAPSDEDILLTARLVDVGKLLGIQVLDHVIIGSHEWYSFADHGRLK